MNALSAVPRTGFKFVITVRSGPDAGAVYQLLPPRITIGRDPGSNNVVVNDARVSRNAAVIEFTPQEITILDTSGRARMTVNGIPGEKHSLKGGDIIGLGDSQLAFIVEAMQLPAIPQAGGLQAAGQHRPHLHEAPRPRVHQPVAGPKSNRGTFYFIVAVVLGGMIYMASQDPASKKLEKGLKTTGEIEKEISDSELRVTEAAKARSFRTDEEKTRYEEAQRHFLEGFRDYRKGNYARALRSFETSLAIDPEHQVAKRYKGLAEKQRDEMVTQLLIEGRRYREKEMFTRCSAAVDKALVAMTNKDDLKYKDAAQLKRECDIKQENRF